MASLADSLPADRRAEAEATTTRRPMGTRISRLALSLSLSLIALTAFAQSGGWTIPSDAAQLSSPVTATPAVLKRGRSVFTSRCQKCHGPEGRGDGPQSPPEDPAADLT